MRIPWSFFVLLAGLAAGTALPAGADAPPSLAGSWRLVEQYYGSGQRNFVDPDEPLRLTLAITGGTVAGSVSLSGRPAPWPAYFGPDGPRPVQEIVVTMDADRVGVRAEFRVPPAPGDDTWLLVEETLRARPDGKLDATMTVTFERDGERRGSFVWRRVFAREEGP